MSDLFAEPPVWAPIAGFPAFYVPRATHGLRRWDKDGPAQDSAPLPPIALWVVWRRHGNRLVCMHGLQR